MVMTRQWVIIFLFMVGFGPGTPGRHGHAARPGPVLRMTRAFRVIIGLGHINCCVVFCAWEDQ
jgi:hypothetical protein